MRRAALLLLLCAAAAVAAQEKTDTTAEKTTEKTADKPSDSPLVRAAKTSSRKKHKPKKVITNEDVENSHGKLIILPARPGQEAAKEAAPADSTIGPIEAYAEQLRTERIARERVAAAEKKVAELQAELRRVEDAYYAENDPDYRDGTIVPEFTKAKRKLAGAEDALAEARAALQAAEPRR